MANKTIGELTAVTDVIGTDEYAVFRSGVTKKITATDLLSGTGASGYGTSLPGSPTDGQEYTLVDSTTAPTYQWRFRYNAGSSSAYKWEFVGGSAAFAKVATLETTTTSGSWVDLSTVGPVITVPRAGDYVVVGRSRVQHSVADGRMVIGVAVGATSPPNDGFAYGIVATAANEGNTPTFTVQMLALSASDALRMRYFMATAGTGTWIERQLWVTPVRVS